MDKKPARQNNINNEQSRSAQKPFEGAHVRQGDAGENSQNDDGEQVIHLRPQRLRQEVLGQDIIGDSSMNLHTGIQRAQGRGPQVMGSRSGSPNQDNLVCKCPSGDSTAEDIADGKMRKGVWWAKI